jgi:predicted ATPase/class 3 adenylate cyclase/DNA-binding CsgD family transcriptional regulator
MAELPRGSAGIQQGAARPDLPTGLVTFLLTDVERSTALWEAAPEQMRAALAAHDRLFEEAIRANGGIHIRPRGEGDSRFAVFGLAHDAVLAVLAIQRTLARQPWPTPRPILVRIGLHTGDAELRDDDYYGLAVNRCARLRNIGHGGQTLLSEATAVLVRDDLPPETRLVDSGEHRLKDLTRPERVFQLVAADLPGEFPPLDSLDVRPHNLPVHPTPLLGREHEVDAVRRLLLGAESRLVTLTGPGGTGKTRLSIQVAADLMDRVADGVFLVELAPIRDPALVPTAIAQVLGVRDMGNRPVLESLRDHLRQRSVLLVLDNFEQILPAASVVAELLASCPRLLVLVTSREPLRLRGEREFAVPPLAMPAAHPLVTPDDLSRYAAAVLFVERATEIQSDFVVTAENAPAIAEICTRLDGLPLAIELAAARVRLLSPQAILARLERRLPLLTGGSRDLPDRQRTLRDAIAWSYDLLTHAEQALFRRLAIFVGGCTIETAEAVDQADVGDRLYHLDAGDVLDGIESLISKSLLRQASGSDGAPRLTMLETVREYGLEQLQATGELRALQRWHAGHYLALAEEAVPRLRGPEQRAWLDRLAAEHPNLRAALAWSLTDDRQSDAALRLSGALAWFWTSRGHFSEGPHWLDRALAVSEPHPVARLTALYGAGWMAHVHQGADVARQHLEAGLALAETLGDRWATAWILHLLGRVAYYADDAARARELGEASLRVAREIDDPWLIAWAVHLLGLAAHVAGEYQAALAHSEQSLAIRREIGYLEGIGICFNIMGVSTCRLGDYAASLDYTRDSVLILREVGIDWTLHNGMALLATLAVALGQPRRGVRVAGATAAFGESIDVQPIPMIRELLHPALDAARRALGDADYELAWRHGRALSLDEAVAEALAVEAAPAPGHATVPPVSPSSPAPASPAGLSPREIEVLRLIAAGRTSKEVAEALVLSIRTVERHITHVYEKIGARGRADATAFALKHGLADEASSA